MSVTRSKIIKEICDAYPGFLHHDIDKLFSIIINEMKSALKRKERVELRKLFTIEPKTQKSAFKRNPKTGASFFVKEKNKIYFKISKEWAKKINEKM